MRSLRVDGKASDQRKGKPLATNPDFPYAPEAIDLILRAGEYVNSKRTPPEDNRPAADQQGEAS